VSLSASRIHARALGSNPEGPLPPQEDVWVILERFARDINRCDRSSRRKLALEAVRDSIAAEAVYWYPGNSGDAVEIVGACDLPASWCSFFAKKLIDGTPGLDGRLLRSDIPSAPGAAPFQPTSVAMVRVSRSHASWMVALSFSRQRRLQVADLRLMALVRRILVSQTRYTDLTGRMTDTLAWLVQCLTTSIDAHAPHSHGHSERVAKLAVAIGKHMRLPTSLLNDLYFAGLLHDIGITGVPQSLLLKPEQLTDEEYATVKMYPVIGDGILAGIKQLGHLRPTVRHHHEHFDGRGYPDGLSGDAIPLTARILGVADAYDAMRSSRPHRPALAKAQVEDILATGAGKQWDPRVIEHYFRGSQHFHLGGEGSTPSQTEPGVQEVLQTWNTDSSGKVSCGEGSDRRGPPCPQQEAAPP
jgi:HD-GYP domain-containing protein (c-di-GMP phosphodiesterase class II)